MTKSSEPLKETKVKSYRRNIKAVEESEAETTDDEESEEDTTSGEDSEEIAAFRKGPNSRNYSPISKRHVYKDTQSDHELPSTISPPGRKTSLYGGDDAYTAEKKIENTEYNLSAMDKYGGCRSSLNFSVASELFVDFAESANPPNCPKLFATFKKKNNFSKKNKEKGRPQGCAIGPRSMPAAAPTLTRVVLSQRLRNECFSFQRRMKRG
ncbi:hypothetical protein BC936DRAFT_142805 [Jimgerdemannia flammicorona]|uniref:Uncharacterized protein n=1 Tax=Jimgerdemannia flammicorona TaxID=994334 RepID=A0A433DES7_9FUNG|nr:hypothetical protein BC936DRAFT_142805 [Jimgerdemannia flammicorona]